MVAELTALSTPPNRLGNADQLPTLERRTLERTETTR